MFNTIGNFAYMLYNVLLYTISDIKVGSNVFDASGMSMSKIIRELQNFHNALFFLRFISVKCS